MHASERENKILESVGVRGFITFRELEKQIDASPATLRRDLERMHRSGQIQRVRGGAKLPAKTNEREASHSRLSGTPFDENVNRNRTQKEAIGRTAASLCKPGSAVMIDGGSTTLQMCEHLAGLRLNVLTNSLHIVSALLSQEGTQILVAGGTVFREQNIILGPTGDDLIPRFFAPKYFIGAAAIGPQGLMQADVVLVASERRFIERAEQVIVLVDSTKFQESSGNVVCGLDKIDVIVTDTGIDGKTRHMLEEAGIEIILADGGKK